MSRSIKTAAVVLVGVLVVVAAGIGISRALDAGRGVVVGLFPDANTLVVGNVVRSGGVEVGRVSDIGLDRGRARVELEVDDALLPLRQDANLRIRAVNLLGEKYIDLSPGSPGAPELADQTVPPEHTSVAVDVQDVIDGLGDPAATGLATLVTTAGEGLKDRGPELAATLRGIQPAFRRTADLAALLREQNRALNQVVDRVKPVTASLNDGDGATLDRLVGNTERTLSTVAANRRALDSTLAQLPDTVASARRTLNELAGTADAATPTLQAIRPTTKDLPEIARELERFSDAADPALTSLRPVLDRADQLLNQAAPLVADLKKAGPDLRSTAKELRPLGDQLLDKQLKGVLDFVKLWAMSTNGKDSLSHYFRGVATATPENFLQLICGAAGAAPAPPLPICDSLGGAARAAAPALPAVPGAPQVPGLAGLTGGDAPTGAPAGAPAAPRVPLAAEPGNATGLSPAQEQSMVGQMLGGQ